MAQSCKSNSSSFLDQDGDVETFRRRRESEIKNGRVAMQLGTEVMHTFIHES